MEEEFEYTVKVRKHSFQTTFYQRARDADWRGCGVCPFSANHPVHIPPKSEPTMYSWRDPDASWNNPK